MEIFLYKLMSHCCRPGPRVGLNAESSPMLPFCAGVKQEELMKALMLRSLRDKFGLQVKTILGATSALPVIIWFSVVEPMPETLYVGSTGAPVAMLVKPANSQPPRIAWPAA